MRFLKELKLVVSIDDQPVEIPLLTEFILIVACLLNLGGIPDSQALFI